MFPSFFDCYDSNFLSSATAVSTDPSLYQSAAAAAYVHQYGNWQNAYYQQFSQPMNPTTAAAFPGWPGNCYGGAPHWSSYGKIIKKKNSNFISKKINYLFINFSTNKKRKANLSKISNISIGI